MTVITNAKYSKVLDSDSPNVINCVFGGEQLSVPINPANRHYAEIMRQVDAGELTIAEAD